MLFKNDHSYIGKIISKIISHLIVFIIGSAFGYYWAYNALEKCIK